MSVFNSLISGGGKPKLIQSGDVNRYSSKSILINVTFDRSKYLNKRLVILAWVVEPEEVGCVNAFIGAMAGQVSTQFSLSSQSASFHRSNNTQKTYSQDAGATGYGGTNYIMLTCSSSYSLTTETFHYEIYSLDE